MCENSFRTLEIWDDVEMLFQWIRMLDFVKKTLPTYLKLILKLLSLPSIKVKRRM